MSVQVHIHRDAEAASLAAAKRFIEVGQSAIEQQGRFCAALAGGTTPIRMYELLAEALRFGEPGTSTCEDPRGNFRQSKHEGLNTKHDDGLNWGLVHIFFSDERCVPPDHAGSNYATVRQYLLDRIDVPEHQVHRIESELVPYELAAERYESMLRTLFGAAAGGPPEASTFDLVLLGVGQDGHTASLFPGSRAVAEKQRWAVHTRAPQGVEVPDRVTLTLPVINAARRGMFLVTGANKSRVVRPLLAGVGDCGWPAAMIRCVGGVEWHLDEAAAGVVDTSRAHNSNS